MSIFPFCTHTNRSTLTQVRTTIFLVLGLIFSFQCTKPLLAQTGNLDPTFGDNGMVITDITGEDDQANAVAIQSDGKIVVAGVAFGVQNKRCVLQRYTINGRLDASFGNQGRVMTDVGVNSSVGCKSMVLQPDGKIVLAGDIEDLTNSVVALWRFNSDGSPDVTFGNNGIVTTQFDERRRNVGRALRIQSDGKLVVIGTSIADSLPYNEFLILLRYNNDGSLDGNFDADGKVIMQITSFTAGRAIAIQPDGKIIVTADFINTFTHDIVLLRYNTDGSLDSGFADSGKSIVDIAGGNDLSDEVVLQSDGKIVVAATALDPSNTYYQGALLRYHPDGRQDSSFDGDGKLLTNLRHTGRTLLLQNDGKIVLSGSGILFGAPNQHVIVRYHADGSPDASFGENGKMTTDVGNPYASNALAFQQDGKLLVAGRLGTPLQNTDMLLMRYLDPNSPAPPLPVPEPLTLILFTTGIITLGAGLRRHKRNQLRA